MSTAELAVSYAALILADDNIEINVRTFATDRQKQQQALLSELEN